MRIEYEFYESPPGTIPHLGSWLSDAIELADRLGDGHFTEIVELSVAYLDWLVGHSPEDLDTYVGQRRVWCRASSVRVFVEFEGTMLFYVVVRDDQRAVVRVIAIGVARIESKVMADGWARHLAARCASYGM